MNAKDQRPIIFESQRCIEVPSIFLDFVVVMGFHCDVSSSNIIQMQFSSTFTDPNKKIYYPHTWGGKTAMERYEDMKQQFWYVGLGFLMALVCGAVWWFLVYTYTVFIRLLWRISKCDEDDPQRIPYEEYLELGYVIRWAVLGVLVYGSTVFFCVVETTRMGLLYGFTFWVIVFILKRQTLWLVSKLKKWAWNDQIKSLHSQ